MPEKPDATHENGVRADRAARLKVRNLDFSLIQVDLLRKPDLGPGQSLEPCLAAESPAADDASLRDILYAAYVSGFKGDASTITRPLTKSQRAAFQHFIMPSLAGLPRDATILELGCGDGGLLAFLAEKGFHNCQGVDCSVEQVALAQARGVAAEAGNLFTTLAGHSSDCDAILLIDVIEHMTKPELARLGRLLVEALKPGGRVVLQTPNGEGICRGHIVYGDLTHETIFNQSSISQFLRAFGFEEIVVRETGPVPHSLFGVIRGVVWRAVRFVAQLVSLIQAGRWPQILTAVMVASARKPRIRS